MSTLQLQALHVTAKEDKVRPFYDQVLTLLTNNFMRMLWLRLSVVCRHVTQTELYGMQDEDVYLECCQHC